MGQGPIAPGRASLGLVFRIFFYGKKVSN